MPYTPTPDPDDYPDSVPCPGLGFYLEQRARHIREVLGDELDDWFEHRVKEHNSTNTLRIMAKC